ncbi:response regulator transcription factor [Bradyrhizobium sp. KBS0727]|uniref:LuxR C-terminal-related transcriptional regulator n=1 Tax=unclassified Bradyrhizobium TaxID=2631580 RepID=UPI00110D786E|nr:MULTISPECIES: response regulator transcription factor [unclassified Bradyrhizobium]QDW40653.1 response regulator transcription factor [Bradyrhizobium sp. KBS0725]QDW47258.1 response regulator transcription factor [Bradyrhizobium sp. KBS0727]
MSRQQSFSTVLIGRCVLIREGIGRILRAANIRTSASVSCADDLPPGKLLRHQLLFLIVHAGDDIDVALEQIELLRDNHPGGRIAIVADHYRLDDVASAFRVGVNGYFVDVMTCDLFTKSVELVAMGETIFPPAFLTFALAPERLLVAEAARRDETALMLSRAKDTIAPQLSPREQSILQCLIEGNSNKGIARKINIAEATVKVHVKAILRKIRVQNRTQAAIWGMNNGSPRPANDSFSPSTAKVTKGLPKPLEVISEIRQIEAPVPLGVINHEANHVAVSDRLIREGINRRTHGTVRSGK